MDIWCHVTSFSNIREKWGFGDEIGGLIFPIFKKTEDMLKTIALAAKKSKQKPKSFPITFWDSCGIKQGIFWKIWKNWEKWWGQQKILKMNKLFFTKMFLICSTNIIPSFTAVGCVYLKILRGHTPLYLSETKKP